MVVRSEYLGDPRPGTFEQMIATAAVLAREYPYAPVSVVVLFMTAGASVGILLRSNPNR